MKKTYRLFILFLFTYLIGSLYHTPVIHASPEYSYKWISQTPHITIKPGETARLWVLIENTGTITWDKNIPIHLGTDRPMDHPSIFYENKDWLSANRPAWLTDDTVIKPGERAVFMFEITAPSETGIYKEYFRPVVENIGWLEDYGIYWEINVTDNSPTAPTNPPTNSQGIYRSELISQGASQIVLAPGETKTVTLQIKNIGTATWYNNGSYPVRLATARDWDRKSQFATPSWISPNRVTTMNESKVEPSQIATYSLSLKAPDNIQSGAYFESFQSVAEGITWFMDYNIDYTISVRNSNSIYGLPLANNSIDEFLGSGDIITITDLARQESFKVKALGMDRWHSDVVPLTKADTEVIRNIYNFRKDFVPYCPGEDWILWKPDAVTVEIDSDPEHRIIAAAIDGCAHDIDGGITDNDFPGHFDLHFLDSMMHGKEEVDCSFQKMVQKSAGNPNWSTYGQAEPCWNPCVGGGC